VRIAWFTTYGGRSAIADYSRHVVEALATEHDVELWVPEARGPLRAPVAPIVRFTRNPLALARLHRADAIVYNVGNDIASHRAVLAVAGARPGVVVLHDAVMRHYYGGLVADRTWSPERYLRAVSLHHGPAAAEAVAAARIPGGDLWSAADTWEQAPLFAEAIAGAAGVVVHGAALEARVRAAWAGPVARLDLPAHPRAPLPPPPADEPVVLAGLGGVTANRRIEDVVGVLAARPDLARRVRYVVAGTLADDRYTRALREEIGRAGLGDVVRLAGYVPEAELDELLASAHVFVNLRHPSTEGASASLLAQAQSGRPVIVTDGGSFADVPDDVVLKVPPGDLDALAGALERLVADPGERAGLGAAGRRWAAARTPRAYADGIAAFLTRTAELAPLLALCDRVGRTLAQDDDEDAERSLAAAAAAIATLAGSVCSRG
jgi:glycosyltransferase involved in cell wall biosynthesis